MSFVTREEFEKLSDIVKKTTLFLGDMMKDNDRRFDAAKDIMQQIEEKINLISDEGFCAFKDAIAQLEQRVITQNEKIEMLFAMFTGLQTMVDIVKDQAFANGGMSTR